MNRLLLCLALIAALVSVQTLSLHAHLANGETDSVDSHLIHVHSHTGDVSHHGEAEPGLDEESIDLLTSTAARDAGALHLDLAVTLFLTLLVVVWHSRRQRPRIEPPVRHSKPPYRRPSPRAPPLFASPF